MYGYEGNVDGEGFGGINGREGREGIALVRCGAVAGWDGMGWAVCCRIGYLKERKGEGNGGWRFYLIEVKVVVVVRLGS